MLPADQTQSPDGTLISLFPSPVLHQRFPDVDPLNEALEAEIRRLATETASVNTSNVGGFHSGPDFLNRDTPCVVELRARLQRVTVELTKRVLRPSAGQRQLHFELLGWANRLGPGDYHAAHSHPGFFWSGVYYVTDNDRVPEHPLSGRLEIMDPRGAASVADPQETTLYGRYLLDPVAGQLVVFPAWLSHCVHPYRGTGDRLSIGFNVRFQLRAAEPAERA